MAVSATVAALPECGALTALWYGHALLCGHYQDSDSMRTMLLIAMRLTYCHSEPESEAPRRRISVVVEAGLR